MSLEYTGKAMLEESLVLKKKSVCSGRSHIKISVMWLCKNVSGKYKIKPVVIGNAKTKHSFTDIETDGTHIHYYSQKGP
jgi:hypothetical protein